MTQNPQISTIKVQFFKTSYLLFYGPAGVGKTFIAEKVAEEIGIHFMKVIPDDLASSYIHGTQAKIGNLFQEAEEKAPTLLFFDEFDCMVPQRSNNDDNNQNGEVNEFLCMLNNAADRGIYVIAATNHSERIDKAVLRTGRIDELIYVDMPDMKARESLFKLSLGNLPIEKDINYSLLAEKTRGFNCSDIGYIVQIASRNMFNESIKVGGKPSRPSRKKCFWMSFPKEVHPSAVRRSGNLSALEWNSPEDRRGSYQEA